jgi:S1-C subfamily serine protease
MFKLLITIAFLLFSGVSFAAETEAVAQAPWSLEELNTHVENTNWIVDDQCSGSTTDAKRRLILTNFHCVANIPSIRGNNYDTDNILVSQNTYDEYSIVKKVTYSAVVVYAEPMNDLALLQIRDVDAELEGQASLAPSTFQYLRGEKVYIVGNPALEDMTLVVGYISAPARTIYIDGLNKQRYFQMSGGVVGGASGGGVYNEWGELIGVTSAGTKDATFIGYAIPLSIIENFLNSASFFVK